MKTKLFAILLFVMSYISVTAQQYKSVFGSESTSWNQYVLGYDNISTDSLFVTGDTIIDSRNYKIIGKKYGRDYELPDQFYLYETPDHSKVYQHFPEKWYSTLKKRELLVVDLNMKVNDKFYLVGDGYVADSSKVDSIYFDEQQRKHIRFDVTIHNGMLGDERFEFIEGIGTNFGLFYQVYNIFFSLTNINYLLCTHHNDTVAYYGKLSGGICSYFDTSIEKIKEDQSLVVAYNSKSKALSIRISNMNIEECTIDIFNANGKLIRNFNNASLPFEKIVNLQEKGVYVLKCLNQSKVFTGKLVLQ